MFIIRKIPEKKYNFIILLLCSKYIFSIIILNQNICLQVMDVTNVLP